MKKEKNVTIITSVLLILLSVMLYSILISVSSITSTLVETLAATNINDLNHFYTTNIIIQLSIYSVFQLAYLASFIYNKVKAQYVILVINLLVAVAIYLEIINIGLLDTNFIIFLPIINSMIYIIYNKFENKKEKTKNVNN